MSPRPGTCRMDYSFRAGPGVPWEPVSRVTGVPLADLDVERESALHRLDVMAADRLTLTGNPLSLLRLTVFDDRGRVLDSSVVPMNDDSKGYQVVLSVLAEGDAAGLAEVEVRRTVQHGSVPWRELAHYPAAGGVLRAFAEADLVEPGHLFGRAVLESPEGVELMAAPVVLANPAECREIAVDLYTLRQNDPGPLPATWDRS